MKSFAKPRSQAQKAVRKVLAIGQARHDNRDDGKIHSIGTARSYEQSLKLAAEWDHDNGGRGLAAFDSQRATIYLTERAEVVTQKTLDLDRQALQVLSGVTDLPRIRSDVRTTGHGEHGRAYTTEQIEMVAEAQNDRNKMATEIAAAAGLRAHELLTLRSVSARPASTHRTWRADRFVGLGCVIRYTVVGKGGLIREVAIPMTLAERLEAGRLSEPHWVTDRAVHYETRYDVGGGNAWSNSFGGAAKRVLGWSTGAHGVRHSYAQNRLETIQSLGYRYGDALEVVSQEMGHFRAEITEVYLR